MPELPEVEHARRSWLAWLSRRRLVRAVPTPRARAFREGKLSDFKRLAGRLRTAERRGKVLVLAFEEGVLRAHLGMTGKFVRRPKGEAVRFSKGRFELDDGTAVHFVDARQFGTLSAARDEERLAAFEGLGFDPLVDGVTGPRLKAAVGATALPLKVALMDQSRVAGLGNIHAAEALLRAGVSPTRKAASLSAAEWAALARGVKATIALGLRGQAAGEDIEYVEEGGDNPFLVYGQTHCQRCGAEVERFVQAGRTTHWCPRCQR